MPCARASLGRSLGASAVLISRPRSRLMCHIQGHISAEVGEKPTCEPAVTGICYRLRSSEGKESGDDPATDLPDCGRTL